MYPSYTCDGRARIGALKPVMATLIVNDERLSLRAGFAGQHLFYPENVVSIEVGSHMRWGTGALRIFHTLSSCPSPILFLVSEPSMVVQKIVQTGFQAQGSPIKLQVRNERGFPFHWYSIAVPLLWWNWFLFLAGKANPPFFYGAALFGGLAFVYALWFSKTIQEIALKPGRSIKEVLPVVRLMAGLLTFFFMIFVVQVLWMYFRG